MQKYMGGLSWDETAYLYEEGLAGYQPVPYPSEEGVQMAMERDLENVSPDLKPSDFYDASFLREIEQSGFIQELYK
jgi:hypothetical protein